MSNEQITELQRARLENLLKHIELVIEKAKEVLEKGYYPIRGIVPIMSIQEELDREDYFLNNMREYRFFTSYLLNQGVFDGRL